MSKYLDYTSNKFTQEHYNRQYTYPYVAYSKEEDRVIYSIVKQGDKYEVNFYSKSTSFPTKYVEVDLGLPSGTKWLDRNIGATSILDPGAYFSWGNTEGVLKSKQLMTLDEIMIMLYGDSYTQDEKQKVKTIIENNNFLKTLEEEIVRDYKFTKEYYDNTYGAGLVVETIDNEVKIINTNDNNNILYEGSCYDAENTIIPNKYDTVYSLTNGKYSTPSIDDFKELLYHTKVTMPVIYEDGNLYEFEFEFEQEPSEQRGYICNLINTTELPSGWNDNLDVKFKIVSGLVFTGKNGNTLTLPISNCYSEAENAEYIYEI